MDEPKKGSMFCGGCCDMRRAVIIVNTIGAALGLIAFGYCSYIYIAVQSFKTIIMTMISRRFMISS